MAHVAHLWTPELAQTLTRPTALLALWAASLVLSTLRYVTWSAALYWYFYRRGGQERWAAKIQSARPSKAQIRRELAWSLSTCFIYSLMTVVLFALAVTGHTRLYVSVAEHGWPYLLFSIVLMYALHDTYFYWTHRLAHKSRWLFRRMHRIHHQSLNPTPFADIMFHPLDAVMHAGFVPLFLFALPLHPLAIGFFLSQVTVVNALGHIGFELFPSSWQRHPVGRWVSRPTAHNLHHSRVHCNYGLYFSFWDRVCGTERLPTPPEADVPRRREGDAA